MSILIVRTTRLCRSRAEKIIEAFLDDEAAGWPTYSLIEDGDTGWAFWIDPDDTTSYLDGEGRVQWLGSSWPECVAYDGFRGVFLDLATTHRD